MDLRNKIKEKIESSEIESAIRILVDLEKKRKFRNDQAKEVLLLSSRMHDLKKKNMKGIISLEGYQLERNKITDSLLLLLDTVEYKLEADSTEFFEHNNYKKLGKKEFYLEIEKRVDSLIFEVNEFYDQLNSRDPNYEWIEDFLNQKLRLERKWDERRFQVAVMALIKSGKSTLLNSWIGDEYLPSAVVAETMKIIRIRHNPKKMIGVLTQNSEELARGADEIRGYIRNSNLKERKSKHGDGDGDGDTELILEVNLASLQGKDLNDHRFDILDTPGTNELGIPTLQGKIELIAKSSDVIIYLLDYTKLKTLEEGVMFGNLKGWREELFEQLKSRLFFVVNKIDASNRHDREKEMTTDQIKNYVQNILVDTVNLKIDSGNIILISAERALLGRLIDQNIASEDQKLDFKLLAFGEIWAQDATGDDCKKAVPKILEKSGFSALEEKVLNVIYTKRSQILVSSILDDLEKYLDQVINNLEVGKGTLLSDIEDIAKLKEKISSIRKEIDSLDFEKKKFKKKANKLVDRQLKRFESEINTCINQAFSDTTGSRPRYSWIKPVTDLVGNTDYVIFDTNKAALINKLGIINDIVAGMLDNRFDLAWNNIIEEHYDLYLGLQVEIEEKTRPMIKRIESVVNESFKIELNPAKIEIEKPSLIEFYRESKNQIEHLVSPGEFNFFSNIINVVKNAIEDLIRTINKILGVPNQPEIKKEIQKFEISSKLYKKYILQSLEKLIIQVEEAVDDLIKSRYIKTIDQARSDLDHYASRYIQIIEKEIDTKKRGVVNIPLRIENIDEDILEAKRIILHIDILRNMWSKNL